MNKDFNFKEYSEKLEINNSITDELIFSIYIYTDTVYN